MLSAVQDAGRILWNRSLVVLKSQGLSGFAVYAMDAVWHLPKRFRRLLTEATFDRRMGVQTSPLVAVTDLGVELANWMPSA